MVSKRQEYRNNTPSFGGKKEERLSNLLPKSVKSIHEDFKKIRREMYRESSRKFDSKTNSRFSHNECEHAATHCDVHHSQKLRSTIRKMGEKEEMTRRKTLSDFLKEN